MSVSFRLPKSLVERARRAARDYAGKPAYLTLGGLVQDALENELRKYERESDSDLPPPPPRRTGQPAITINSASAPTIGRRR